MKSIKQQNQEGIALFSALILSVIAGAMMTTMIISFTGQNKVSRRSQGYEQSLVMADMGIQRFTTALVHSNDAVDWQEASTWGDGEPSFKPNGFWLWQWHDVKNEQGEKIGSYRIEMLPVDATESNRRIRLKAYGKFYTEKDTTGAPKGYAQRAVGLQISRNSLGDFAIASNHDLAGARINGGVTIHGGLLTGGALSLDSSSTGIYNDYGELDGIKSKGPALFSGFVKPNTPPNGEVFVYKDNDSNPTNNGTINLSANAGLGRDTHPLKGIHTEESSTAIDPGTNGGVAGDGIIGQGEANHWNAPRDHKMPDIEFPDASKGSEFMEARKAEAISEGKKYNASQLDFQNGFSLPGLSYNKTTKVLTIADGSTVYIEGNLTIPGITYSGKGGLFVDGDVSAQDGLTPVDRSKYPQDHALAITASGTMNIGKKEQSSTLYAGFFFGNEKMNIMNANIFGNVFGNTVEIPSSATRPTIMVHPEVMGETGVTLPEFTRFQLKKDLWWEFEGRDSRHS